MNEQISEIEYSSFIQEIKDMFDKDQEMRKRALENDGVIEDEEDDSLDLKHTERMKEIVNQIGWPTIAKVGVEVSNMAWLLVQHADHDVKFQKKCLELMRAQSGEVSKRNVAYLEDRVRVNEGRPQLYGTQFGGDGESYGPRPIEEPERVNERRAELGMESLEEYTKILKEKYKV